MAKSAFKEWFKVQYGGRFPDERKRHRLAAKIHELKSDLHFLEDEYRVQRWLADSADAALKGWNAAPESRAKP